MAFPTTSVLDDFNRADSASMGANWTGALWSGEADLDIVSNQAKTVTGTWNSAYWNPASFGPDCEVFCEWRANRVLLNLRCVNIGAGTLDGYEAGVSAAVNALVIFRTDNEVGTQLGAGFAQAFTAGDLIGFEAVGSSLSVYYKAAAGSWTLVGTETDGAYSAAGRIGLEVNAAGILDDFGGGTVVVVPAQTDAPETLRVIQSNLRW